MDILGRRPQVVGKAYSADHFQIAVAGTDHDFLIVQNVNFNYAQNVTRLFDLENAEFEAYVAARPQGQLTMANVVANLQSLIDFMQTYGDVCAASSQKNITIEVQGQQGGELCNQPGGSISFTHPVLVSTALTIAVGDYVVNNNMAFIFASALSAGAGSTP